MAIELDTVNDGDFGRSSSKPRSNRGLRGSFNASFGAQLRRKSLHIPHPRRCTGNFDRLSNYRFLPLINPAPCPVPRSTEHTSELHSLMRTSSAASCLYTKKSTHTHPLVQQ